MYYISICKISKVTADTRLTLQDGSPNCKLNSRKAYICLRKQLPVKDILRVSLNVGGVLQCTVQRILAQAWHSQLLVYQHKSRCTCACTHTHTLTHTLFTKSCVGSSLPLDVCLLSRYTQCLPHSNGECIWNPMCIPVWVSAGKCMHALFRVFL